MKLIAAMLLVWLVPWGAFSIGLLLAGKTFTGLCIGTVSFLGVTFVFGLARAARGN